MSREFRADPERYVGRAHAGRDLATTRHHAASASAPTGAYVYVRHPQYGGFALVMFGFLLQWPTLLTLAMFPVLVFMYLRLARAEEREVLAEFGSDYERYRDEVPAFVPRLRRPKHKPA